MPALPRWIVGVFAGVALCRGAAAMAQTPPPSPPAQPAPSNVYRYRLLGVFDEQSGDPLAGVEVSDVVNGNKALTSPTGTVSLLFLPEGMNLVRLRKVGYSVQTISVRISPIDTMPITIVFTRATQLPTVVVKDSAPAPVSARLRAFEEHKKAGFGQFIAEDELRKNDNRTLANVLAGHLAGIQTILSKSGLATYIGSSRKQCQGRALSVCVRPNCYVRIFTDGVLTWDTSMGEPPDFSRMNPEDYAAVEFYPGGGALPEGISPTRSDCGTLVLYSRER